MNLFNVYPLFNIEITKGVGCRTYDNQGIEYLDLYNDEQKRRHDVKPGITGWAQVNGRNAISWEQKFDYDVWYVDNQSFWLDIKILWLTFLKVVKRSDISSSTSSTMEKFTGSKK